MPISCDLLRSFPRETGVLPALVPLFTIEPYQLEEKVIASEMMRASSDRAKLFDYLGKEEDAYEDILPRIGTPPDIILKMAENMKQFMKAVNQNDQAGIDVYMNDRNKFFVDLHRSGNYPGKLIQTLESYEWCVRRMVVINFLNPAEFTVQFNDGKISVPRVTTNVRELWLKRDDSSGAEGIEVVEQKLGRNELDLVTAISEQILADYKRSPNIFASIFRKFCFRGSKAEI